LKPKIRNMRADIEGLGVSITYNHIFIEKIKALCKIQRFVRRIIPERG